MSTKSSLTKRVKDFVMDEFILGYTLFERLFLLTMLAVQIIVFALYPETAISIISGIAGVISVVLCAKGKISFYYIGFIQTISYLYLAWQNRFYGEFAENIFYLVTMVIGIFLWRANSGKLDDGGKYVKAKVMSGKMWIASLLATVASTILTGVFLESIGSQQAYTDAATNVLAIFAQILMIKGYREQWAWWIAIDLICIKLWLVAGNWSMVAMYIAWTINCIYGWYNWSMLNNRQKVQLNDSNLGGIL